MKLTVISYKINDDLISSNIIVDTEHGETSYVFNGEFKSMDGDLRTFQADSFSISTSQQALKSFKEMRVNKINGNKNEVFSERQFNITEYEKTLIFDWIEMSKTFKVIL